MRPEAAEAGGRRLGAAVVALGLVLFGSGCVGPRGLELTRLRYEEAVHETNDQQWLRNLVRLRYGELPTFLDVAAINSQLEMSGGGSITGGQERDSANRSLFGGLTFQYRDAPTLSYVPRAETDLTRALVSPVGVTALGLMANTGWNPDEVLRLMVAEVNGLANAPGADRIAPAQLPSPTAFEDVLFLIARMQLRDVASFVSIELTESLSGPIPEARVDGADLVAAAANKLSFRPTDAAPRGQLVLTRTDPAFAVAIAPEAVNDPDVEVFRRLLHLRPGRLEYRVRRVDYAHNGSGATGGDANDGIAVRTRTILEMMAYLAKAVPIPEAHHVDGSAGQTLKPDGQPYDWTQVTRGFFCIQVQEKKPHRAAVAIHYRGHWYFIDDADHRSKSTLALIQALLNIQLTEPDRPGPLLTLPVGL